MINRIRDEAASRHETTASKAGSSVASSTVAPPQELATVFALAAQTQEALRRHGAEFAALQRKLAATKQSEDIKMRRIAQLEDELMVCVISVFKDYCFTLSNFCHYSTVCELKVTMRRL